MLPPGPEKFMEKPIRIGDFSHPINSMTETTNKRRENHLRADPIAPGPRNKKEENLLDWIRKIISV